MEFPTFFTEAPKLVMRDPLAAFLGVSDGVMTYEYADAVRLSGHSCPTVAGAYLMLVHGLKTLYGHEMPERGAIEVFMRDPRDEGTTGVIAAVATLLTGAAPETGFAGVGGRFSRRDLLHFSVEIPGLMALRRCDNGKGVVLDLNMAKVPPRAEMKQIFPKVLTGRADVNEEARFGELWQQRVADMLVNHADDPELVRAAEWHKAA